MCFTLGSYQMFNVFNSAFAHFNKSSPKAMANIPLLNFCIADDNFLAGLSACYIYPNQSLMYQDAVDHCQNLSPPADLVTIHSKIENQVITGETFHRIPVPIEKKVSKLCGPCQWLMSSWKYQF